MREPVTALIPRIQFHTGNDEFGGAPAMMNDPPRSKEGFRPTPKQIIAAIIGLLALIFIFQNTKEGTVNFLFWDITVATWIWLLLVFIAGGVVGYLIAMRRIKRAAG